MNAAEKARLARQAKEEEREERRENFREFLSDHRGWVITAIVILVIGILCAILIPIFVSNYRKTLYTQDGVVYALKDGTYTAKSVEDGITEVTVKGEVNGLPVTGIQKNFGKKSATLKEVTVEAEGDMKIAKRAFQNCTVLQNVTITGKGIVTIEYYAFIRCSALKQITVMDAKVVGDAAIFGPDGNRVTPSITLENAGFTNLSCRVKRIELKGKSMINASPDSLVIAGEFVLRSDIRSEDEIGCSDGMFTKKWYAFAPVYYISADVTKIPDYLFGIQTDIGKLDIYFGGTEAEWSALIDTADYNTNKAFFDLGDKVTVHYGVSYEDFNNR